MLRLANTAILSTGRFAETVLLSTCKLQSAICWRGEKRFEFPVEAAGERGEVLDIYDGHDVTTVRIRVGEGMP